MFPSPSSSTSTASATISTPDQSYLSDPTVSSRSGEDEDDMSNQADTEDEDLFSPTAKTEPIPFKLPYSNAVVGSEGKPQIVVPSISVDDDPEEGNVPPVQHGASPTPHSRRGSISNVPAVRAPPPPSIFLGDSLPIAAPGTVSESSHPHAASKGLNISGLGLPDMSMSGNAIVEQGGGDEEEDQLPELTPTPRRLVFGNADGAPSSPAWQSMDSPTAPSPAFRQNKRFSLDVPSPLGKSRFDPTPTHGIHSRNLSLYFPQPGSNPERRPSSPDLAPSPEMKTDISMAGEAGERNVFGGTSNWSFGTPNDEGGVGSLTPDMKGSKRRGHHHKHSLSHNFFSFLDPTQTNPNLSTSQTIPPKIEVTPISVPLPRFPSKSSASTSLSPISSTSWDNYGRLLLATGALEFLVGSALWVEGQMSGWRCSAAVGYLVVFDAIGLGVTAITRKEGGGWSSIRRPFGPSRYISLLYFAQSLFLVFAAVYIAKESLEQVILGSGAHEESMGSHGHESGAHSHHSHGHGGGEEAEREFPQFLLALAVGLSTLSGGILGNHSNLVNAVGPVFLGQSWLGLPLVQRWKGLLGNAFSLTVVGGCLGILIGIQIVPPSSLHSLDSLISLLLTILTVSLSYPSTVFFAHILLQTAPPGTTSQMRSFKRALKYVKDDRRVIGLGTIRCWSVSVGQGNWEIDPVGSGGSKGRAPSSVSTPMVSPRVSADFNFPSSAFSQKYSSPSGKDQVQAPLVITLTVHVHPDASDQDLLEVTKMAWNKVRSAVGAEGQGGEGEVSVYVKRGWEGVEET